MNRAPASGRLLPKLPGGDILPPAEEFSVSTASPHSQPRRATYLLRSAPITGILLRVYRFLLSRIDDDVPARN
ncbi:MAG: hypothetical protein ACR2G4_18995 [Pyrinomonadaceae bacterium]